MFNPLRLYNYLRNRHWKEGIPEIFLKEWISMNRSQYTLTEEDRDDFEAILRTLQIDIEILNLHQVASHQKIDSHSRSKADELEILQEKKFMSIPSVRTDWSNFRQWMLDKIIVLERILDIKDVVTSDIIGTNISLEQFTERLELKLEHIFFERWIGLYKIDDRYRFLLQFVTTIDILHNRLYGKDKLKDMPIKIKKFKFKLLLEKELIEINRIRNDIVHKGMKEEEINLLLEHTFSKIRESYFHILVHLANKQIVSVVKQSKLGNVKEYTEKARDYIIKTYFTSFSPSDVEKIINVA